MRRLALILAMVAATSGGLIAVDGPLASASGPPSAPGSPVGVDVGDGTVTLSWAAPSTDNGSPITGYVITPFLGGAAQPEVVFNSAARTETVTELSNGSSYTFRVAATNAFGTGPQSVLQLFTPGVIPGSPIAPTAPTATAAGSGSATVSWTAPARDNGSPITGYVITAYIAYRNTKTQTFNSIATSETITGLNNGENYRFKVAAINARGVGLQSAATNLVGVS